MFMLFDARCEKCHNPFKAEADSGSVPGGLGRYMCVCPRCYTAVTVWGEHGVVTAVTSGWAIRATVIDTDAVTPDRPT